MSNLPIVAIAEGTKGCSVLVFDGKRCNMHSNIEDNYSNTNLIHLLSQYNPALILVSRSLKIVYGLESNEINHKNIHVIKKSEIFSKQLNSSEKEIIGLIKTYIGLNNFVDMVENDFIGYLDKYPIYKMHNHSGINIPIDVLRRLNLIGGKNTLPELTITSFGRKTILYWLRNPCITEEDIKKRIEIQIALKSYLPRISKLLKKCKIQIVKNDIKYDKLKKAIRSVLTLARILPESINIKNRKLLIKIYKICSQFNNDRFACNDDPKLSKLVKLHDKMPRIMKKYAIKIMESYKCVCDIIYIPELGFHLESDEFISEEVAFQIKNIKYYKTFEMRQLDRKYGNIYRILKSRRVYLQSVISSKIKKYNLGYFYDFIGEIDAIMALIKHSYIQNGLFSDHSKNQQDPEPIILKKWFGYENVILYNKTTILYESKILEKFLSTVILNQIGAKIAGGCIKLPIYKKIFYKFNFLLNADKKESTFIKEIKLFKFVMENSDESTLCLVDGIGHYTNTELGNVLFNVIADSIKARTLLIASQFTYANIVESTKNIIDMNILAKKNNDIIRITNCNKND